MVGRVLAAGVSFLTVLWAGGVGLLWAAEPYLVFMTGNSRAYTAPLDPAVFQPRLFKNHDGLTLQSVLLKHDSSTRRYTILFCQPAGGSTQVRMIQEHLKDLFALGYDVFAFDYRGFGSNGGTPSEQGLYADAAAAYSYLIDVERVPASRIILSGRSLGGAVAIDLATKKSSAGLLLFSPIDSVPAVAERIYPWAPARLLAQNHFNSAAKAETIIAPVLYFSGWPDTYMPRADARVLFDRFRGPKRFVETGGGHHHSGFTSAPDLYRGLTMFWPVENP
ncbi:MAG: alpha/beta hydrolase [Cyanobacteria bacterium]|nr:alpha/beta hydrolase [Cyanobacteriota bacterium]